MGGGDAASDEIVELDVEGSRELLHSVDRSGPLPVLDLRKIALPIPA